MLVGPVHASDYLIACSTQRPLLGLPWHNQWFYFSHRFLCVFSLIVVVLAAASILYPQGKAPYFSDVALLTAPLAAISPSEYPARASRGDYVNSVRCAAAAMGLQSSRLCGRVGAGGVLFEFDA